MSAFLGALTLRYVIQSFFLNNKSLKKKINIHEALFFIFLQKQAWKTGAKITTIFRLS